MPLRLLLGFPLLLSLYAADAGACLISAQAASVDSLVVAPPGEESFELRVLGLPIEVTPGEKGLATVTVLGPLVFSSEHSLAALDLRTSKRSAVMDDRVWISKDQHLSLAANAEARTGDSLPMTLPLLEFLPETSVDVPCSDLTVGDNNAATEIPSLLLSESNSSYIETDARLPLYAKPGQDNPLWMQFKAPLQVIEQKKDWLRVRARWSDGSKLRGWLPANAAVVKRGRLPLPAGHLLGRIGIGHCGRSHAPQRIVFQLRPGTPIHNRAKGAIWAHSASRMEVEAFALDRSDGWLQIAEIDGFPAPPCSAHRNIWVHASDLVWTERPN